MVVVNSNNIWVRNMIECPLKEYLRLKNRMGSPVTTSRQHGSLNDTHSLHDMWSHILYPSAEFDKPVRYGNITGKIDAIDGYKVIEFKVYNTPVSPLFGDPLVLQRISDGIRETFGPLSLSRREKIVDDDIYDYVGPDCIRKNPYATGCVVRIYFGVELNGKMFYWRSNKLLVRTPFPELKFDAYKMLSATLKQSRVLNPKVKDWNEASVTVGIGQALSYAKIRSKIDERYYEPILSVGINPPDPLPAINIEISLGKFMDKVRISDDDETDGDIWFDLSYMKKIIENPKEFRNWMITKSIPCDLCELRDKCPFRKNVEKYDDDIRKRNFMIVREILDDSNVRNVRIVYKNHRGVPPQEIPGAF